MREIKESRTKQAHGFAIFDKREKSAFLAITDLIYAVKGGDSRKIQKPRAYTGGSSICAGFYMGREGLSPAAK